MGILDSLFGSDKTTVKNEVSWPPHFEPLARDVAGLTQNLFERPQQVWTGQRSAGPSAMRLASFGKAAEIGGGQGLGMGDRMGALMDVAGNQGNINTAMSGLTPEEIEKRMNPYTQGWIQKTLDSSDRGNDRARARRAARRAGTPGSRGMLAETFADTEYGRNRDLLTAGMQKGAYERSEDVLERERERLGRFDIQNRSLAGTLSTTASRLENEELERNMRQMGALRAAGAEQEAFQNQQIQDNMDLFREVRDYPENRLSLGTSVLSGVPTGSTQTKDTGRNIFSQILGAGATVAGLGLPGGGTIGGSVFKSLGFRRGGRIGLQGGGGVPSPEMVMSLVEEFQSSGQPLPPELMMAAQEMGVLPPMPLPQGGNPPQAPSVPLPRPRAVAPGALAQAATDIDAMPPTTSGVPGRQMDQGMGRGALAMAAPVAAPTPSAPQQDQSVMGALGKYFGEVNPSTGRSQLFEIGTRLMAAGAPNAQGIDRGLFGNMGLALRGAEDSREKAIKARQASRLASRKLAGEFGIERMKLRAAEMKNEVARIDRLAAQAAKEENWDRQAALREESTKLNAELRGLTAQMANAGQQSLIDERERRAQDREAKRIVFTPDEILRSEGLPDINMRSLEGLSPEEQARRRERNISGIESKTDALQEALEQSTLANTAAQKYLDYLDSKGYEPGWSDRLISHAGLVGIFGDEDLRLLESITNTLAPAMRQGLPGAASDRDVAMFKSATIGVNNTLGNNRAIARAMLETRKLREAKLDFMAAVSGSFTGSTTAREAERAWNEYLNSGYADVIDHSKSTPDNIVANENRLGWREYFNGTRDGSLPKKAPGAGTGEPKAAVGKKSGARVGRL